jgi:hypothetical protein
MGSPAISENTLSGIDERNQERWLLIRHLRVFNANDNQLLGHIVNVTTEGIMLIGEKTLSVDSEFKLKMELPLEGEISTEIELDARSVWCKADVDPIFYNTGFQFTHCAEKSINAISALIERLKRLQSSKYSTALDVEEKLGD